MNDTTKRHLARTVGGVTNNERADWAQRTLALFANITDSDGETVKTLATDLLCDLAHLSVRQGEAEPRDAAKWVWDIAEDATRHFEAEAFDEPDESARSNERDAPAIFTYPALGKIQTTAFGDAEYERQARYRAVKRHLEQRARTRARLWRFVWPLAAVALAGTFYLLTR